MVKILAGKEDAGDWQRSLNLLAWLRHGSYRYLYEVVFGLDIK